MHNHIKRPRLSSIWQTYLNGIREQISMNSVDCERLIMKGCMQWNPVTVEKLSPRAGARSVGQH